jgi:hypothetical protein
LLASTDGRGSTREQPARDEHRCAPGEEGEVARGSIGLVAASRARRSHGVIRASKSLPAATRVES